MVGVPGFAPMMWQIRKAFVTKLTLATASEHAASVYLPTVVPGLPSN